MGESMLLANKKKGVSIMVGYLLLVVFVIIISVLVYTWLKSYVPAESIGCPEGVSISLDDYYLDCDNKQLNITVKNTGRFNYLGFFIHGSNDADQEIATIDFSAYLDDRFGKMTLYRNAISYLSSGTNRIAPGNTVGAVFDFSSETEQLKYITLVPARLEEKDGRERFAICSDSLIRQNLDCSTGDSGIIIAGDCDAEDVSITCASAECGDVENNCEDDVTCPNTCDVGAGETCINNVCVEDNCVAEDVSITCASAECGSETNNCGEIIACTDTCDSQTEYCENNLCVLYCGDGVVESEQGEECDDGNVENGDGCSSLCFVEIGWLCDDEEPSTCSEDASYGEDEYCVYLGHSNGDCTINFGVCNSAGGIDESTQPLAGDYCPATLCCFP